MFCNVQGKLCIIVQNSLHSLKKDCKGNNTPLKAGRLDRSHLNEKFSQILRGAVPTKMIRPSICEHTRTEALSTALHARCEIVLSQLSTIAAA